MAAESRFNSPVNGRNRAKPGLAVFIFLFLLIHSGFGQSSGKNTLQKLQCSIYDSASINQLNEKSAGAISLSRQDSALYYANLALTEAIKINYQHGIGLAYLRKAQIAKHFDDDIRVFGEFSEKALHYLEQTFDQEGIDIVYYYLFSAALAECRYEEAMDYSEKYYAYARKKNDQNEIYRSLMGMFELNRQVGNYEKCFSYAQQLYDIAIRSENRIWIANALWNLGQLYTLIEAYPEALNYYRRVFEMSNPDVVRDRVNSEKEIWYGMGYAEAFSRVQQFDSAWKYYQLYKPPNEAFKRAYRISTGEYYFLKGNFYQALGNFRTGLKEHREHHDVNGIMRSLMDISRVYLALDSSLDAISNARQGLEIALHSGANQNIRDGYQILSGAFERLGLTDSSNYYFRKYTIVKDAVLNAQAKVKFAAYNYEQRIELMKKEKQIQEIQLQKETLLRNIFAGAILFLVLLAIIIFRNITLKRRFEARQRELSENQLRIQILESDKSRAELLQQRSELEMKALRAQMNPHFIFNCLNSINRFILRNDATKAADYLTKFAKLIRIVLEKSTKPYIPLDEELKFLRLYMDLEAIRFDDPFTYEINAVGFDDAAVMIPSLLIQPIVENAIWHGLYNRVGSRGKIIFNLSLEKEMLHCEISDNGIGMAEALAIKGIGTDNKKSFGIELTRQRLKLANPEHFESLGISFLDLKDVEGKASGTCVIIDIPVKLN